MGNPQPYAAVGDAEPESGSTANAIFAAILLAVVMGILASPLGLTGPLAFSLTSLAGAATLAGAAAIGKWRPQWLGDRNKPLTWLMLRLVVVAFALVAITGILARPEMPRCPRTYTGDIGSPGGALLHSKLVGDTVVCTYEHRGGL